MSQSDKVARVDTRASLLHAMPNLCGVSSGERNSKTRVPSRAAPQLTYTVRLRPLDDPFGRSPHDRLRLFLRTVEAQFAFRADFVPEAADVYDDDEAPLPTDANGAEAAR